MKKNLAKILLFCLIPLTFNGCFGSDSSDPTSTDTTPSTGETLYSTSDFSMIYPQDWEILEKDDFTSNVPLETIVDFRSNVKNEIFTANINISVMNIEENLSAQDFAKSSLAKIKTSLIGFQEILNEPFSKENSYILEFEGKKSPSDPVVHFRQLHFVNGEKGYVVTAAYAPAEDESVVNAIDGMLNSFALK